MHGIGLHWHWRWNRSIYSHMLWMNIRTAMNIRSEIRELTRICTMIPNWCVLSRLIPFPWSSGIVMALNGTQQSTSANLKHCFVSQDDVYAGVLPSSRINADDLGDYYCNSTNKVQSNETRFHLLRYAMPVSAAF